SSIIQSLFIILFFFFHYSFHLRHLLSFPTRRSSDLSVGQTFFRSKSFIYTIQCVFPERRNEYLLRKQCSFVERCIEQQRITHRRPEEHTSELQSLRHLVCRLLLEKKKKKKNKQNKIK